MGLPDWGWQDWYLHVVIPKWMQKPRSEEKRCCVCGRIVKKEETIDMPDEGTYCISCYEQKYLVKTASQTNIADLIEKLGKLKEKGLITNEEFEAKKNELLKRL